MSFDVLPQPSYTRVKEYFHETLKYTLPEPEKVKRLKSILRRHLEKDDAFDLLEMLEDKMESVPLSRDFHNRLTPKGRDEVIAVVRDIAGRGRPGTWAPPSEDNGYQSAPAPKKIENLRRLVDEDNGRERMVAMDDPDILDHYIDYNIKNVTSDYDATLDNRPTMVVHYENKKSLTFVIAEVPVTYKWPKGVHLVRINRRPYGGSTASSFIRRGGFVFPVDADGNLLLNTSDTPNLVNFRSAIQEYMRRGNQLVELAWMTHAFNLSVGALGSAHGSNPHAHTLLLVHLPRPSIDVKIRPVAKVPGPPRPTVPQIAIQQKKVTRADMIRWEGDDAGHTLAKHSPALTKQKLYERVMGENAAVPPPQIQPGGQKPPDFRVWRGKKNDAASAWASEDVMHRTVGNIINKNIKEIRDHAAKGLEWKRENLNIGERTGGGWVLQGQRSDPNHQVMWNENLSGATIVIRPRKNYVPVTGDPDGGWYVHTSHPDVPQ